MKKILLLFFILVAIASNGQNSDIQSIEGKKNSTETKHDISNYSYNIIQVLNNTWCYDIYKDKKLFIHQTSMPGLPGIEGFKTKSDSEKIAKLVIEKLRNGEMPPSITKDELIKLKVL